jgi:hypothetical protein
LLPIAPRSPRLFCPLQIGHELIYLSVSRRGALRPAAGESGGDEYRGPRGSAMPLQARVSTRLGEWRFRSSPTLRDKEKEMICVLVSEAKQARRSQEESSKRERREEGGQRTDRPPFPPRCPNRARPTSPRSTLSHLSFSKRNPHLAMRSL